MATVIIIAKLLPESPEVNLDNIKEVALSSLKNEGANNVSFEEKPIAFGLKALMVKLDFPEEKGTDVVESLLSRIPQVSSVTIEDYRRAFG